MASMQFCNSDIAEELIAQANKKLFQK